MVTAGGGRPAAGTRRTEAWAKLVADPGHAPELLALAAVQTIGPRAQDWADRVRVAYPHASERAVARLATRQFTRFGSVGSAIVAVAGAYAPIALLGTAALTHAELVLHLAVAYGNDPTSPERAADLLILAGVHASRAEADAALTAARLPAYEEGGFTGAAWRFGRMLAAQAGGIGLLRLVNRYFPGTALLGTVLAGRTAADQAAVRANAYYRRLATTHS